MSLTIDLFILIFFVANIIIHYKLGILKSLFSITSFILSIILSKILQPIISKLLALTPISSKITSYFTNIINLENSLNPVIENVGQNLKLPSFINNFILDIEDFNTSEIIDLSELTQAISSHISATIVNILSFILTFLIIFIALRILFAVFNFTFKLPILSNVNKFLGGIFGIIKSLIIIWVVYIIIIFLTLNPNFLFINEYIYSSKIASILYENNYLLIYILKYFKILT